ncbi:type II toxin-antitoxin system PemK/MazF family toxin [Methylovorus glucosotrophus]|uniref:Transcriptional modulator of MazE/toxin, MazF n=1 Tax=Methylovorus glucosotrophus (strain SIP3-4) TaxID=582744 RepID=C6XEP1_METGS|nr:type II toxin-antitoxin system PemK/MazF family toxin [Methylovorus glucosotrophus]ACT52098.1 transcriptional modulator of MazE/toxin, MazF [Methylovorus glucosotrophus SIP3-4]
MTIKYSPTRGDIVLFHHPSAATDSPESLALVLSPKDYNIKTGLILCCPISSKRLGYPFEVADEAVAGAILADQIRSIPWHPAMLVGVGQVKNKTLGEVGELITLLIGK